MSIEPNEAIRTLLYRIEQSEANIKDFEVNILELEEGLRRNRSYIETRKKNITELKEAVKKLRS